MSLDDYEKNNISPVLLMEMRKDTENDYWGYKIDKETITPLDFPHIDKIAFIFLWASNLQLSLGAWKHCPLTSPPTG